MQAKPRRSKLELVAVEEHGWFLSGELVAAPSPDDRAARRIEPPVHHEAPVRGNPKLSRSPPRVTPYDGAGRVEAEAFLPTGKRYTLQVSGMLERRLETLEA